MRVLFADPTGQAWANGHTKPRATVPRKVSDARQTPIALRDAPRGQRLDQSDNL